MQKHIENKFLHKGWREYGLVVGLAAIRTMIVSLQKGDLETSKRLRKVYNQEVGGMSR